MQGNCEKVGFVSYIASAKNNTPLFLFQFLLLDKSTLGISRGISVP